MAQALLYASWIASRLGWKRLRTGRPLEDGAGPHPRGRYEMVELAIARADRRGARRRAAVGPAAGAGRDRRRRVHHRPRRRRGDRRHECRRDDRPAAPGGAWSAARERAAGHQLVTDRHDEVYEAAIRAAAIFLAAARGGGGDDASSSCSRCRCRRRRHRRPDRRRAGAIDDHGRVPRGADRRLHAQIVCPLLLVPRRDAARLDEGRVLLGRRARRAGPTTRTRTTAPRTADAARPPAPACGPAGSTA